MRGRFPLALAVVLSTVSPLALATGPAFLAATVARAQERAAERPVLRVRAAEEAGFARLRLDFDRSVTVSARSQNGVLVIAFGEPVDVVRERIGEEAPSYVSMVRRDPDGTGLRMALSQNFEASVLPAGETVFVDLLPEAWRGLAPGLPEEVVADLARRASAAEARFAGEQAARRAAEPVPMPVRVAELPGLARLIFAAPDGVPIQSRVEDGRIAIVFDARLALEPERTLASVPGIASVEEDDTGEALYVRIALQPGYAARGFQEDGGFVLDVEPRDAAPAADDEPGAGEPLRTALGLAPFLSSASSEEAGADAGGSAAPVSEPSAPPTLPQQAQQVSPEIATAAAARAAPISPQANPAPVVSVDDDGLRITFPVSAATPAAAFSRAGSIVVVFQTAQTLRPPDLSGPAADFAELVEVAREGAFVTTELRLREPRIARLTPEEQGWTLSIGAPASVAPEPIVVRPVIDERGRTTLELSLLDAAGVHWMSLHDGGERLAVVTAPAPPRHTPATRRFAELELLPTAHGAVIVARADDLVVRSDFDGVRITRGDGLSVALPKPSEGGGDGEPIDPVLERDAWMEAQRGSALAQFRTRLAAVIDAPAHERSAERLDLAMMLLANGLALEAGGVFRVAVDDEPELLEDPRVALLEGILAAERRRFDLAEALLSAPVLEDKPEAILWRAYADAQRERWAQALLGFRRAARVIDLYPDDLQGRMRLAAARAAIGERDFGFADTQLSSIAMLHPGAVPRSEVDLLRAFVDMETGRLEFAFAELGRLADSAPRPIAAEAELARVQVGLELGALERGAAIDALERLTILWRGDSVEVDALGLLGRLYAEDGRWREAFFTAHTANLIYPDHPTTLALHEETARAFDALFLEGRGNDLDEVETLALFFDFKQFLPIGRRGDEIVRRLADRLVSLGLLDKAAEMLTHQVENRLEGAGRAAVAARLATVHLMNRRPADALATIEGTRIAELPLAVRRMRNLIEARALSDLSRTDLAIEVIADETGPEIDRLRADIWWTGRRWREAGEAHEALAGTSWQGPDPLDARQRTDVLRAALALTLAQDALGLDRLKAKFADKMADSEDARDFALLGDPDALATPAFRDAAREISNEDTLADFLDALEARYPREALSVKPAVELDTTRPPDDEPAPAPAPEARLDGGASVL